MKTKACPYCGKTILAEARKCKHCKQWIEDDKKLHKSKKKYNMIPLWIVLSICAVVALVVLLTTSKGYQTSSYEEISEEQLKEQLENRTLESTIKEKEEEENAEVVPYYDSYESNYSNGYNERIPKTADRYDRYDSYDSYDSYDESAPEISGGYDSYY